MTDVSATMARYVPEEHGTLQRRFGLAVGLITLCAVGLVLVNARDFWHPSLRMVMTYAFGKLTVLIVAILIHFITLRLLSLLRAVEIGPRIQEGNFSLAYLRNLNFREIALSYAGLTIVVSSFTIFKSEVVGARGYTFDALFASWDYGIFGRAPWELTHSLWSSPAATAFLDTLYHPLFLPMLLGYVIAMVAQARPSLRYTYICTYLAGYVIIGMIFADLLPSAGPIYDGHLYGEGKTFGPLIERLAILQQLDSPLSSKLAQDYLLTMHSRGNIGFGGGISAMPSMHIVLAFLWVVASWHINRWVGIIFTVYGLIIWAASVHLGWHYFVDGLMAVCLITPLWWMMGRLFGLYGPHKLDLPH